MRSGFQINYRHSVGNLHIYLCGEFNGMCAWELIKTIRRQRTDAGRIFVNTADLKQVVSAGAYMFKSHMTRKQLPSDWLYFKGEKGFKIAPDGSRVIISKKNGSPPEPILKALIS
ncbi:hypothetical protein DSCA_39470 [Desulfosarcina alkanivorans]|jgi:hypothetical protein|uniref:Uncharacterized protein n=1 Tax=Desulfosarcina alkanivorans TaxID=571177 RepID=A0A5K7YZH8_9BACT|nr:hypothetical protein DSCA_39470 [Desulfosarcina alkanivorans]